MFFNADHINIQEKQDDSKSKSALNYFVNKQNKASFSFFKSNNLIAAIKIPPKQEKKTYSELRGSSIEDQKKIIEIFSTMGSNNKINLLIHHKKHLEKLGKEIEHVHPLKLIGVIFSTPNMKMHMNNIYGDYFKWKSFADGFEPNMNNELSKNNLLQHVSDFASHVNIPEEKIKPFFHKKDWKGLVKCLIYN